MYQRKACFCALEKQAALCQSQQRYLQMFGILMDQNSRSLVLTQTKVLAISTATAKRCAKLQGIEPKNGGRHPLSYIVVTALLPFFQRGSFPKKQAGDCCRTGHTFSAQGQIVPFQPPLPQNVLPQPRICESKTSYPEPRNESPDWHLFWLEMIATAFQSPKLFRLSMFACSSETHTR